MPHVKHRKGAPQHPAATNVRNLRTLLLMQAFEQAGAAAEIGARIKQARKERGLTQADLAAMLPFSERSLQDYENGVTLPYRNLAALSRVLNRRVEWFLHGDQEQQPASPEVAALAETVAGLRVLLEELRAEVQEMAAATGEGLLRLEAGIAAVAARVPDGESRGRRAAR